MDEIRDHCAEVARHDEWLLTHGGKPCRSPEDRLEMVKCRGHQVDACPRTARALLELAEAVEVYSRDDFMHFLLSWDGRGEAPTDKARAALARAAAILRGEA